MTVELISIREFARRDGCDERMVRKGITAGYLVKDPSTGKLDAAKVGTEWRTGNRDKAAAVAARQAPAAGASAARPPRTRSTADGQNRRTARTADSTSAPSDDTPPEHASPFPTLAASAARKEHFLALQREQEYRARAGELVELSLARRVLFGESRRARDLLLRWPADVAALVASDLGVEPDRVAAVLTQHVRRLVSKLGEPRPGAFGEDVDDASNDPGGA